MNDRGFVTGDDEPQRQQAGKPGQTQYLDIPITARSRPNTCFADLSPTERHVMDGRMRSWYGKCFLSPALGQSERCEFISCWKSEHDEG